MSSAERNNSSGSISEYDEGLIKKYEEAIEAVDLSGKFQKLVLVTLAVTVFSCCMLLTTFPIQKELPDYFCVLKSEFEDNKEYTSIKMNKKFRTIHKEECVEKFCKPWVESTNNNHNNLSINEFQSPILWVLIADYQSVTNYVTALDLMCEIESYSGDFTRLIFLGRIFGTLILSYISDKYGRLPVLKINLFFLIFSNFGFFFFSDRLAYLIFGVCSNITMTTYNLTTIISVEIMSNELYSMLNGLIASLFAFSGLFSIAVMFVFKNWFGIIGVHLGLNIVSIVLTWRYMVETPKYCLVKREYEELECVIAKMAQVNGTYEGEGKVKEMIGSIRNMRIRKNTENGEMNNRTNSHKSNKSNSTGNNINSLFSSIFGPYLKILYRPRDLENMIKLIIPFITVSFVYYGQLMFVERLPGNIKLNSFLIFFSELFSPNLAGYLLRNYARRRIISTVHLICVVICLIFPIVEHPLLVSILVFSNSFCICLNMVATYVFTAEIFDTSIKSSANGLLVLLSNCPMVIGDLLMGIFPSPFYLFALLCGMSIYSILKITEKEGINKNVEVH